MTKYPLSKEPLTAVSASNYLKMTQNQMVAVATDLSDAITLIKGNLIGSEFESACVYINNKILCSLSDAVDDINDILHTLTNAINDYNNDIYDAEGTKYNVSAVNYETGITLDFSSVGGVKHNSNLTGKESITSIVTSSNSSSLLTINKSENYTYPKKNLYTSSNSSLVNSNLANADSVSSIFNLSIDVVHLIINYCIKNIGTTIYDGNSNIKYEGYNYNWDTIITIFLKKHGFDTYIKSITFEKGVATCYLKNGDYFQIEEIENYEDLLKGIMMYKGENLVE